MMMEKAEEEQKEQRVSERANYWQPPQRVSADLWQGDVNVSVNVVVAHLASTQPTAFSECTAR